MTDGDHGAGDRSLPTGHELAAAIDDARGGHGASVSVRELPARDAEAVPGGDVLRPALAGAYPFDPYSHQAAALDALDRGENVVVATSTASGKTDVYALQILRNLLDAGVLRPDGSRSGAGNDGSTALCVYPTKALAADQRAALADLYDEMGMDVRVRRYDGDTPRGDRREIRERADVVLTNPMGVNTYLHDHDRWRRVFGSLDLVALDESHTHTGIQGMHVAWILRRLRRVVDEWGGDPGWVLTSATVGNPGEHGETLLGEPVTVVDDDGSPRGRRDLVLWNPPADGDPDGRDGESGSGSESGPGSESGAGPGRGYAVDDPPTAPGVDGGVASRVPASVEAPRVWRQLADAGVQSLLFCPSRKLTEVAVRRALAADGPRDAGLSGGTAAPATPRLEAYNAGLGKLTRQRRESAFKAGEVDGLATTSALELGIDIGGLDATVLLGYPGQRQSFWQRVGRAGRGRERSLGVLVADHRTLDQYVVADPDYLLESDVEDAVVDTENDAVFARHVLCAADEMALDEADLGSFADPDRLRAAVEMWRRVGKLDGHLDGAVHYAGPRRPQSRVDLYGTDGREYDLELAEGVDPAAWGLEDGLDVEQVARNRAFRDYHEGAVRLLDGQQFEVVAVADDRPQPTVTVEPVDCDYYTRTLTDVNVMDAEAERTREVNGFTVAFGTGTVVVHHHSYDRVDVDTNEPIERMLDTGRPAITLETQLCWVEVPDEVERTLVHKYADYGVETGVDPEDAAPPQLGYVAGLHAAEHAMIKTAPLELLVDQGDLGGLSTLVLDGHFADPAFDDVERVGESLAAVEAALERRSARVDGGTASGWFVYDGVEGGLGFSRAIYENVERLAARARDSLADCQCGRPDGCPACTYSENCGNDNAPLLRASAVDVFDLLVGDADPAALREHLPDADDERRSPALFYA